MTDKLHAELEAEARYQCRDGNMYVGDLLQCAADEIKALRAEIDDAELLHELVLHNWIVRKLEGRYRISVLHGITDTFPTYQAAIRAAMAATRTLPKDETCDYSS